MTELRELIYLTNDAQFAHTEDAMTGQCDHVVGFLSDPFTQFGGTDRLLRQSEGACPSELFNFCPLCGGELTPSNQAPPMQITPRELLQLIG
jgi:hypothetical protein